MSKHIHHLVDHAIGVSSCVGLILKNRDLLLYLNFADFGPKCCYIGSNKIIDSFRLINYSKRKNFFFLLHQR